jgi:hypothetical protein
MEETIMDMLYRAATNCNASFDMTECGILRKVNEDKFNLIREQAELVAQLKRDRHIRTKEQNKAQYAAILDGQEPNTPSDAMTQQL